MAYADNTMTFEVTVDGPYGQGGTLTGSGTFGPGPPYVDFTVTGTLGGHRVNVTVPAN